MPKLSHPVNPVVIALTRSTADELNEGSSVDVCGEIVLAGSMSNFSASFPFDLIFPEENGISSAESKHRITIVQCICTCVHVIIPPPPPPNAFSVAHEEKSIPKCNPVAIYIYYIYNNIYIYIIQYVYPTLHQFFTLSCLEHNLLLLNDRA